MTMTTFPPEVASAVSAVVAGAGALDLSSATPCADFDLKALINHVIGTTAALARVGRREPLDPTDPYGEHTDASGGDWQGQLTSNLDGLAQAWAEPQAWEGSVDMASQIMPAPMIGEMALAEVVLHGWDLARATGQRLVIEEHTAAELRRSVEATAELGRQMSAYGPAVEVAPDASDFDRALAASGRDPDWTAG